MTGNGRYNVPVFPAARWWRLAPLTGSVIFTLFYLAATAYYPGGSQEDVHAKGFSWVHNYWCNLLNEKAINGEPNGARPFAYAAMAFLLLTFLSFWIVAAQGLGFSKRAKAIVLISGIGALMLFPFLPTAYHDAIINVSGFFGLVATGLVYAGLYKKAWRTLLLFGIFNLFLVALNNYIYYTTSLYYLPLVQKFTFVSFLLWVSLVTLKLYQSRRNST